MHTAPRRRLRASRLALWIATVALVGGAILSGVTALPVTAHAATLGPGYERDGLPAWHLGGYLNPDGSVSYCIEPGRPSPLDKPTTDAGMVGQVNGLSETAMIQLNSLLARHGNTADDTTSAAVAMAVWSIASNASYQAEGGDAYVLGRAPAELRPSIQALADQYRAEAAAYVPPVGSATLSLSIDATSDFTGYLDVATTPAEATGTVTLTNGVFADTGSPTRQAVPNGAHLAVTAVPPADGAPYRVTAKSDDFTAPGGPAATVHLYSTPGAQTLTASGAMRSLVFSATATDVRDRVIPPPPVPPAPAPTSPPPAPTAPPAAVHRLPIVSG
ncbi:hypothetical protein [Lacisediminihabitans changchengi]|uniref:TQXA domain-containing protein n=1 Tax=Lacisediminihabitans changchengi TaxID=2787634 RepID=A0A934SKC5_9MICO|nr:hypothetical protein [Lacisediminihabitans changchengi]MBK4346915.1 hypothetical protein [Lacisediminihabitans changchengi]MBK4347962.1 hypothetical protein [Lacisediminihabitans changchengi]